MLGDADAKPSSVTLEESSSEQQLLFPMWVVPIREMLALAKSSIDSADGLPWHEVLHEQGTLRCWEAGMNTLFFSHTWLGWHHPDPNGDKCRLIVALLEGVLAGRVKVSAAAMATIIFGEQGVAAEVLARVFADGYVWMDFLSIPQRNPTNQGLAIQSLPHYVANSTLFVVLAGPWKHANDGSIRDVRAWGERGWCRMENLANSLSPKQKTLIVAESTTSVFSHGPRGIIGRFWTSEIVGEGTFSVEADKAKLGPTILRLIEARKAKSDREDDVGFFRFLCAISSRLLRGTGVELPKLPLAAWLVEMRFSGACDDETTTGLSPLASPSSPIAPTSSLTSSSAVPTSSAAQPTSCRSGSRLHAAGRDDPAHVLHVHGRVRRRLPNGAALARGQHARLRGNAAVRHAAAHGDPHVPAPPDRPADGRRPNALASAAILWAAAVGDRSADGEAVVRHVLDNYSEQLQGLPDGVNRYLDLDGQSGIVEAMTAEGNRRSGGALVLQRSLYNVGDTRVTRMLLDAGYDPNGDIPEIGTERRHVYDRQAGVSRHVRQVHARI